MRHGITECRECQFCLTIAADGDPMIQGLGTCRLHAARMLPESSFGYWPIVFLTPGNGCREGIRMETSAAVE